MLVMTDATKVLQNLTQQLKSHVFFRLNGDNQRRRKGNLIDPEVGRDATALKAELSLTAFEEGEDLALGLDHIPLASLVYKVELSLRVKD